MADDRFTAIVVGAGPAGASTALVLARQGVDVLLVERAETPGSKNMFGGRMYSWALHRLLPGFWEEAPVERVVTREVLTLLDGERALSLSFQDPAWGRQPCHSFTLLRADFDAWLAAKAEEEGAILAAGIRVDDLLWEEGKVAGIRAGDDEIRSEVVVLADGANSLLTEKAGLRSRILPHQVGTGFKQVISLPEDVITARFGLEPGQGLAQLFVGACTRHLQGGGFLYTNRSTLSLGLVVNAASLQSSPAGPAELLEDFKSLPCIAPLVEGGEVVEYSAHLVPEAGLGMKPQLVGDGVLVAGDAAGMVINLGYLVRGMDLAVASGEAAAHTVLEARARNDFSRASLAAYETWLQRTAVLPAMEAYRQAPHFLDTERIYRTYPALATGVAARLFTVDGSAPVHLLDALLAGLKASGTGVVNVAMDAWKGGRAL